MIRSILLIKFKPDSTEEQIEAFHRELRGVDYEGRRHFEFHRDLKLTDDAMDAMIIADFDDEAAYRGWVACPGHLRVRGEFLDPIRGQRDRFLYEV